MKHQPLFPFEKNVIDPVLIAIRDNQEYLTKPENLPQLAKLGYIYNTLWYAGRICWGYDGLIVDKINEEAKEYFEMNRRGLTTEDVMMGRKEETFKPIKSNGDCEDNPKYKIEMCDPLTDKIDNLIYGAWGMHICDEMTPSWEEFENTIKKGKTYTDYDLSGIKEDKTFEEWVSYLMDERHEYRSKTEKDVADLLLCRYGSGYAYKKGHIVLNSAGGEYGEWENAIFRDDIKKTIDDLMAIPEVYQTMETANRYMSKLIGDKKAEDNKRKLDIDSILKVLQRTISDVKEKIQKYKPYYPICEYSPISQLDKNSHPSYIKAAIKVCEDILQHEEEENNTEYDNTQGNTKFATKFLKKFKK